MCPEKKAKFSGGTISTDRQEEEESHYKGDRLREDKESQESEASESRG